MASMPFDSFLELDSEIKQEFYEDVVSAVDDTNRCVALLKETIDDELIARIFRAIHTIKGNCNMVFLNDFVDAIHRLEDLFSAIRSKEIDYDPVFGHFAIKIVNLIQKELKQLINENISNSDVLKKIQILVEQVEKSSKENIVSTTLKANTAIDDGHFSIALVDNSKDSSFSFLEATDFEFLEYLSHKVQETSRYQTSFYQIASKLCLQLNDKLKKKVDEPQLLASMMLLHLSAALETSKKPSALTLQQIIVAQGLLSRMPGWNLAATLSLQVLEQYDGKGIPLSLSKEAIHPAAQVISLSFHFAYEVLNAPSKEYKKALFTAVKAINSEKEKRYKGKLIERFTHIIKSNYLCSKMF
jgi:chemotaxis protein histidine kinase CheA